MAFLLSAQVSVLLTTTLLYATRQGSGDFRTPALFECVRGLAVMVGAGAGAYLAPTPEGIAAGALAVGGGASVLIATWIIRELGVSTMRAFRVMMGPPVAGLALALILRLLADRVQGYSGASGPRDPRWAIEGAVGGFGFLALYALVSRIFFRHVVRDMLSIAPGRLRRLVGFLA